MSLPGDDPKGKPDDETMQRWRDEAEQQRQQKLFELDLKIEKMKGQLRMIGDADTLFIDYRDMGPFVGYKRAPQPLLEADEAKRRRLFVNADDPERMYEIDQDVPPLPAQSTRPRPPVAVAAMANAEEPVHLTPLAQVALLSRRSKHKAPSLAELVRVQQSLALRLTELQKRSGRRLPRPSEKRLPKRRMAHWDYVLLEMRDWQKDLVSDAHERQKVRAQVARNLQRHFARRSRDAEANARRFWHTVSRDVMGGFWHKIERLLQTKLQRIGDEKRREELDERLQLKVSETEKMSARLSVSLKSEATGEGKTDYAVPQPSLLRFADLRYYQRQGLDWLVSLHRAGTNGILADEMGLGKTVQTIALLAHLAENAVSWGAHLIVVPTSVLVNWEVEFKRWCPSLKVLAYHGTPTQRAEKRRGWTRDDAFNVCIVSYKLAVKDSKHFRRKRWDYMVLDEAHNIKNFKSQRWQTLLNFHTQHRLLLTGTPLQNHLMELWSLMHFLMPEQFDSQLEFREWFSDPINCGLQNKASLSKALVSRLHTVLRPFILRRLKKDVAKSLPPKTEKIVPCRLSLRQRRLYQDFMAAGDTQKQLTQGGFLGMLNVLMQLRKVCNHPNVFAGRPIVSPFDMLPHECIQRRLPGMLLLDNATDEGLNIDAMCLQRTSATPTWTLSLARRTRQLWQPRSERSADGDVARDFDLSLGKGDPLKLMASASPFRKLLLRVRHRLVEARREEVRLMNQHHRRRLEALVPLIGADTIRVCSVVRPLRHRQAAPMRRRPTAWWVLPDGRCQLVLPLPRTHDFLPDTRPPVQNPPQPTKRKSFNKAELTPEQLRNVENVEMADQRYWKKRREVFPRLRGVWQALRSLVLSPQERLEDTLPIDRIQHIACIAPKARAHPAQVVYSSLSPHVRNREHRLRVLTGRWLRNGIQPEVRNNKITSDSMLHHDTLHPIRRRQQMFFPDKRLLQWDCGKLQRLYLLLEELRKGGHRALIFTQMTRMLDVLEEWLNIYDVRYLRLDGTTPVEDRQRLTEQFNRDPSYLVFISSTRSGGLGINLTGADTVIFYDTDWNPAMDLQAQDRCHRIGQTRPVTIYRLITKNTVEENILRKAQEKKLLNATVIGDGAFTVDYLQKLNPRELLGLDAAQVDQAEDESKVMDDIDKRKQHAGEVLDALAKIEDAADTKDIMQTREEMKEDMGEAEAAEGPTQAEIDFEVATAALPAIGRYALSFLEEDALVVQAQQQQQQQDEDEDEEKNRMDDDDDDSEDGGDDNDDRKDKHNDKDNDGAAGGASGGRNADGSSGDNNNNHSRHNNKGNNKSASSPSQRLSARVAARQASVHQACLRAAEHAEFWQQWRETSACGQHGFGHKSRHDSSSSKKRFFRTNRKKRRSAVERLQRMIRKFEMQGYKVCNRQLASQDSSLPDTVDVEPVHDVDSHSTLTLLEDDDTIRKAVLSRRQRAYLRRIESRIREYLRQSQVKDLLREEERWRRYDERCGIPLCGDHGARRRHHQLLQQESMRKMIQHSRELKVRPLVKQATEADSLVVRIPRSRLPRRVPVRPSLMERVSWSAREDAVLWKVLSRFGANWAMAATLLRRDSFVGRRLRSQDECIVRAFELTHSDYFTAGHKPLRISSNRSDKKKAASDTSSSNSSGDSENGEEQRMNVVVEMDSATSAPTEEECDGEAPSLPRRPLPKKVLRRIEKDMEVLRRDVERYQPLTEAAIRNPHLVWVPLAHTSRLVLKPMQTCMDEIEHQRKVCSKTLRDAYEDSAAKASQASNPSLQRRKHFECIANARRNMQMKNLVPHKTTDPNTGAVVDEHVRVEPGEPLHIAAAVTRRRSRRFEEKLERDTRALSAKHPELEGALLDIIKFKISPRERYRQMHVFYNRYLQALRIGNGPTFLQQHVRQRQRQNMRRRQAEERAKQRQQQQKQQQHVQAQ